MHKCLLAKSSCFLLCFRSDHQLTISLESGKEFVVKGTGRPLRQFIYSRDLARLMIWSLREYPEVDPILLSVDPEAEMSIADAARQIASAMKYNDKIVFDTTQADGQFQKTASNAKLRKYLPDFKFTPFKDGTMCVYNVDYKLTTIHQSI